MSVGARPAVRILLVDDSEIVRRGIKTVLAAQANPPIHVIGEAGTVAVAAAECARLNPDIVLLDIRLPDGSGLDVCRQILQRQPHVRILILTSFASDQLVQEAIRSGAHGFLVKEIGIAGLVQAILDVAAGKSILDPDAAARAMRLLRNQAAPAAPDPLASLSPQERCVLALVAEGKTNKEIGQRLSLSGNTVKNYLGSVFEKLQVKRRSQAAAIYVRANRPKE